MNLKISNMGMCLIHSDQIFNIQVFASSADSRSKYSCSRTQMQQRWGSNPRQERSCSRQPRAELQTSARCHHSEGLPVKTLQICCLIYWVCHRCRGWVDRVKVSLRVFVLVSILFWCSLSAVPALPTSLGTLVTLIEARHGNTHLPPNPISPPNPLSTPPQGSSQKEEKRKVKKN